MTPDFQKEKYRIKGCASFSIREGWLTKGLRHIADGEIDVFVRSDATEILGVGSAMVNSIRYWMRATGLTDEPNSGKRMQTFTETGKLIAEYDMYLEDNFSLYLIHYNLMKNYHISTVWYLMFNRLKQKRFTREILCESLLKEFKELGATDFSEKSFFDDCAVAIKTYVSGNDAGATPEDNMQCPLTALNLLSETKKGIYERTVPPASKLNRMAVLYVIADNMNGREGISFESLLSEENNVGKVFNLNQYMLNTYLDELQAAGYLTIQRTAGLNMVYIDHAMMPFKAAYSYYTKRQR